jgi:hypothetical protein
MSFVRHQLAPLFLVVNIHTHWSNKLQEENQSLVQLYVVVGEHIVRTTGTCVDFTSKYAKQCPCFLQYQGFNYTIW